MGRTSDAKERLMHSAGALIHEKGYTAVGVGEICARAGVNKGSFYHFFPSKQKLVLDVIDAIWLRSREMLETHLLGEAPPLERLDAYFDGVYAHHRQSCSLEGMQKGCPLANLGLEMSTQDPVLRDRVLQTFEAQIGYFERLLREAKSRGDLPEPLDPRTSAEALMALLEGKIMLSKLRNDPESLKDLGTQARSLLGVDAVIPAA